MASAFVVHLALDLVSTNGMVVCERCAFEHLAFGASIDGWKHGETEQEAGHQNRGTAEQQGKMTRVSGLNN